MTLTKEVFETTMNFPMIHLVSAHVAIPVMFVVVFHRHLKIRMKSRTLHLGISLVIVVRLAASANHCCQTVHLVIDYRCFPTYLVSLQNYPLNADVVEDPCHEFGRMNDDAEVVGCFELRLVSSKVHQ